MLTEIPDRHGPQGLLEGASDAMLENEFGTSKDDEAVLQILQKGSMQEFEV
jgi:ribosome maturation protein Sdo1